MPRGAHIVVTDSGPGGLSVCVALEQGLRGAGGAPDVRLTHLRHLNHSARFWRELARLCPHHAEARRWLRSSKLRVD